MLRNLICEVHADQEIDLRLQGKLQRVRYCPQKGGFCKAELFDTGRKSCRRCLALHNQARDRNRQPDSSSARNSAATSSTSCSPSAQPTTSNSDCRHFGGRSSVFGAPIPRCPPACSTPANVVTTGQYLGVAPAMPMQSISPANSSASAFRSNVAEESKLSPYSAQTPPCPAVDLTSFCQPPTSPAPTAAEDDWVMGLVAGDNCCNSKGCGNVAKRVSEDLAWIDGIMDDFALAGQQSVDDELWDILNGKDTAEEEPAQMMPTRVSPFGQVAQQQMMLTGHQPADTCPHRWAAAAHEPRQYTHYHREQNHPAVFPQVPTAWQQQFPAVPRQQPPTSVAQATCCAASAQRPHVYNTWVQVPRHVAQPTAHPVDPRHQHHPYPVGCEPRNHASRAAGTAEVNRQAMLQIATSQSLKGKLKFLGDKKKCAGCSPQQVVRPAQPKHVFADTCGTQGTSCGQLLAFGKQNSIEQFMPQADFDGGDVPLPTWLDNDITWPEDYSLW